MKTEKDPKNKAFGFFSFVTIVLVAAVAGGIAKIGVKELFEPKPLTNAEILQLSVKEIKKKLPIKTDEITTFVNVIADPSEMTLIYEYFIENVQIKNEQQRQKITNALRKNVMNICQNEKAFERGINYKWNYYFLANGEGVQVAVREKDCKKTKN